LLGLSNQLMLESANSGAITINSIIYSTGPVPPAPQPPTPTVQPTSCPINFSDVPSSNAFYNYIKILVCRGVISGYSNGTFQPGGNLSRGQVTKFVVNAAGLNDPVPNNRQTFQDVPPSSP